MSYFSEEHKETIEIFKEEVEKEQKEYSRVNSYTQFLYDNRKTVLELIEKQDKELETYKKIAERLAKRVDKLDEENYNYCQSGETHCKETNRCIQCIIDWARKEVENGDTN